MTKAELIEKVKEVIAAPSCCPDAKAACQAYLDAVGTDGEKAAQDAMIAELKEDVTSIEGFIAFSASDTGKKIFGETQAKAMNEAAVKAQAAQMGLTDCVIFAGMQKDTVAYYHAMDLVIFFYNPIMNSPNEPDIIAITRECDRYNIPIATNIATAESMVLGLDHGDLDWRNSVRPE